MFNLDDYINEANIDGFILNNISEKPREIPIYLRAIESTSWEKMNDEEMLIS